MLCMYVYLHMCIDGYEHMLACTCTRMCYLQEVSRAVTTYTVCSICMCVYVGSVCGAVGSEQAGMDGRGGCAKGFLNRF